MRNTESYIEFKKYDIFMQSWLPTEPTKHHIIIVHGLGEHSSCYSHMAKYLTENKISCHGFDFFGHGQSSGQRGYIPRFELFVDELNFVHQTLIEKYNSAQFSIFSHSMGGLVTLKSLLTHSFNENTALIFSNPLVNINVEIPQWKLAMAQNLAQVLPRLTLGNEINDKDLTKDQEVLERYKTDPLRHKKISSKLFVELQENTTLVPSQIKGIKNRSLFLISPNDKVCDAGASQTLSRNFKDARLELFPQSGHEIVNDLSKSKAFDDIIDFLKGTY